jgi:FSR family fosmidomycin resistance protein-like MFS transporter
LGRSPSLAQFYFDRVAHAHSFHSFGGITNQLLRVDVLRCHRLCGIFPVPSADHGYGAPGPIFITWYVARFGLRAMPATMAIGLSIWIYLYWALPKPKGDGMAQYGFLETLRQTLGSVWQPILLIWIVMVMRALVGQSLMTFMPVLWVQKGHTIVSAGVLFSIFTISGTVAGILCGHLSDRMGYKRLLWITHGLMGPFLLVFLLVPGKWIYPATILAGGFNMASLPLGVVMAQKIAPKGRSMVASLMMGLAFGTGGILAPIVGKLGDIFTIQSVLMILVCIPVLSLIPIYFVSEVGDYTDERS